MGEGIEKPFKDFAQEVKELSDGNFQVQDVQNKGVGNFYKAKEE